mmetsp:Transcript_31216/g.61597  ORF Transcript_31216/g.61597 Transcript_31216/m.61597 type:complete len:181 (+) Transcript_31216:1418-1960(+)
MVCLVISICPSTRPMNADRDSAHRKRGEMEEILLMYKCKQTLKSGKGIKKGKKTDKTITLVLLLHFCTKEGQHRKGEREKKLCTPVDRFVSVLFFHASLSVCLSLCLSVCLSVCLFLSLSACEFVYHWRPSSEGACLPRLSLTRLRIYSSANYLFVSRALLQSKWNGACVRQLPVSIQSV